MKSFVSSLKKKAVWFIFILAFLIVIYWNSAFVLIWFSFMKRRSFPASYIYQLHSFTPLPLLLMSIGKNHVVVVVLGLSIESSTSKALMEQSANSESFNEMERANLQINENVCMTLKFFKHILHFLSFFLSIWCLKSIIYHDKGQANNWHIC